MATLFVAPRSAAAEPRHAAERDFFYSLQEELATPPAARDAPLGNRSAVLRRRALLGAARNAVAAGDRPAAREAFARIEQTYPDDDAILFEYAGALMRWGEWRDAELQLRKLLSRSTTVERAASYAISLADVLVQQQRHAEAISMLAQQADQPGEQRLVHIRLGRLHAWQQDWRAAEKIIAGAALEMDQLTPRESRELAAYWLETGRPERSLAAIDTLAEEVELLDFALEAVRVRALLELGRREQASLLITRLDAVELDDARQRLDLADALYRSGHDRAALAIYQQVARRQRSRNGLSSGLRSKLVRTYVRLFKLPTAEQLLGPETEDEDAELLAARINFLTVAGRHAEAESICRRLLKLAPTNPDYRNAYGNLYFSIGDFLRAEAEYRQSLCLSPGSLKTLPLVARAMMRSRQHAEAVAMLRSEMTDAGRTSRLRPVMIEVLLDAGWAAQAERECRAALADARGPRNRAWAQTQLGWALLAAGKAEAAAVELQLVVDQFGPSEVKAVYGLRQARRRLGRHEEAAQLLVNFEHSTGDDIARRMAFADLATDSGDGRLAQRLLRPLLVTSPKNPIVLIRLGEATSLVDRPHGTHNDRDYFREVITDVPTNTRARLGLARSYRRTRQAPQACEAYRGILRELPSHRLAASELSRVAYGSVNPDAGVATFAAVQRQLASDRAASPVAVAQTEPLQIPADESSPAEPSAATIEHESVDLEQRVLSLERQAKAAQPWRPQKSLPLYRAVVDQDRINEEARFDLAQVYGTLGRTRDAASELRRLLELNPSHSEAEWALARTQLERGQQWLATVEWDELEGRDGLTDIARTRLASRGRLPLDWFGRPSDENEYLYAGYAQEFLVDGLGQTTDGHAFLFGGAVKPTANTRLFADLEIAAFDQGFDTRPVGRIGLEHRTTRDVQWTFAGFLNNIDDNSESIAQDIFRAGTEVSFTTAPNWRTVLSGGYRWSDYSDDNQSHEAFLSAERLLRHGGGRRQWRLLADAYYFDFEKQTIFGPGPAGDLSGTIHPYFAPESFAFATVGLEHKRWLGRYTHKYANHWWWSAYAGGRVDSEGIGYGVGRLRLHRDHRAWLTSGAEVSLVRSDVFDSTAARVFLTARWR